LDYDCEEIERTKSYLTIQRMRYRDIMDFTIEAEGEWQITRF